MSLETGSILARILAFLASLFTKKETEPSEQPAAEATAPAVVVETPTEPTEPVKPADPLKRVFIMPESTKVMLLHGRSIADQQEIIRQVAEAEAQNLQTYIIRLSDRRYEVMFTRASSGTPTYDDDWWYCNFADIGPE